MKQFETIEPDLKNSVYNLFFEHFINEAVGSKLDISYN